MIFNNLRALNSTGLNYFERKLGDTDADRWLDPLDDALSEVLPDTGSIRIRPFETSGEMAHAIVDAFGDREFFDNLDNIGLWAWLTFVLRQQLFKHKQDGSLRIGEYHRWYPSSANDWQKGQRHLVRMPAFLFARLGENSDHLLCSPPNVLPEIREQMTGQYDMITPAFQQLARVLYYDTASGKLKRGSGSKGAGSPRRLRTLRRQLGVTWQIEDLTLEQLLEKLPSEFDRFKDTW